jgi:hypothetical protein
VLHIHSTALIVHFRPGAVPNVIMTWLWGVRALGCSRDVAENLRNLLLKRASPLIRLMAGGLSRKISSGIVRFL